MQREAQPEIEHNFLLIALLPVSLPVEACFSSVPAGPELLLGHGDLVLPVEVAFGFPVLHAVVCNACALASLLY